ncbi:mRNA interferase MazF [Geodermatophilus saharensis]|uniref:mRNA interferase MazF n=1 Tax=Geodermatophilus saharensis TaxID=1137994 RepID=A0A239E5L8_9ACTN|nr:type II toxin-antitoxin system PemK/MazF family toxin [Geodermatophilus saharensis]SNS39749.1 mRNA interferase MazF [Geodermatophilus saharensis]
MSRTIGLRPTEDDARISREAVRGNERRGHGRRGRRHGPVLSPTDLACSVATIVPTSTQARPAVLRPGIELGGVPTRFLVDELRSIDVRSVDGEPASSLHRNELEEVEVARYPGR